MPGFLRAFVRIVEAINYRVGRITMYLLFAIMGVLLWSSISKTFFLPSLWTLEMAQFTMVAYYFLGGPYSLQLGSNVRMDLFYGEWTDRQKAWADAFTVLALIVYLSLLVYGGFSSTSYALEYNERSPSAWRPYMAPIKIIMVVAAVLMLLQAVAILLKDIAKLMGEEIPSPAQLRGQVE